MNKKIFIINGKARAGKDTFINMVAKRVVTMNVSSVDKVKEAAKVMGWDGISKTEKDRKFLSDLKKLTTKYNDMSFEYLKEKVKDFNNSAYECLFLHIREPEEIKRAKKEFDAKTILIIRDSISLITSNTSDASVFNYSYDYEVINNGTLQTLDYVAEYFVEENVLC